MGFQGGQSIPRVMVADAGSSHLRFLPLPELSSLHGESITFKNISLGAQGYLVAQNTTNSFHLTLTVDITALDQHSVGSAGLQIFGDSQIQLLPPYSVEGQQILTNTD